MTYFQYQTYVDEARQYTDIGGWLAEIGFGADVPYSGENWSRVCEIIYAAANGETATIIGELSARAFAQKYALPERTVQRWLQKKRTAPDYVLELLGFAVISDIPALEQIND